MLWHGQVSARHDREEGEIHVRSDNAAGNHAGPARPRPDDDAAHDWQIGLGLGPDEDLAAAALWWRGMGREVFGPLPARYGIEWARESLCADAALVARDRAGRLVGLAGLRGRSGGLLGAFSGRRGVISRVAGLRLWLWRAGPATADLILDGLVVHPRARRQGIARLLIRAALKEATKHGHPGLQVEVMASNHAARVLYAGEGFSDIARYRPLPWRRAIVLRRSLEPGLSHGAGMRISKTC